MARPVVDQVADYRLNAMAPHHPVRTEEIWWSALLELREISMEDFLERTKAAFPGQLLVSSEFYPRHMDRVEAELSLVVLAPSKVLNQINDPAHDLPVKHLTLGTMETPPVRPTRLQPAKPDLPEISCPRGTVIMGVIDGGIAFAHDLFRRATCESRVESMQIMARPEITDDSCFCTWRILDRRATDALLAANTHAGLLDEDSFYRQAGLIDHADGKLATAMFRRSHGTHVMGLAAGYPTAEGRRDRPIIACQLPSYVTEDVTGSRLDPYLFHAITHIRRQAARFRIEGTKERPPLVINFSYGNFDSPHDGTGIISQRIGEAVAPLREGKPAQEVQFLLPAGNGNLARAHAELQWPTPDRKQKKKPHKKQKWKKPPREPFQLDFRTLPDDRTCSFMSLWLPFSHQDPAPDFISLTVTTPEGLTFGPLHAVEGASCELMNRAGDIIGRVACEFSPPPTSRGVMQLMVHPNRTLSRAKKQPALSPSGLWRVEVKPRKISAHEKVQVWIKRGETLPGFPPLGRQAFFDNADFVRFDEFGAPLPVDPSPETSPVRRAGTLSGFAAGAEPVVVAGFTRRNALLSDYSAAGPITPERDKKKANRTGPDAAAISDESPALPGVLSAGSASGSLVRMNGTSVAAPEVARFMADALAKRERKKCSKKFRKKPSNINRSWVKKKAKESDDRLPPPKPSETRAGGGRLMTQFRFGPDGDGP